MKPTRFLRSAMLWAASAALLSCSEPAPLGPRLPVGAALSSGRERDELPNPDLLSCPSLPRTVVTNVVGPRGGVITFGPHSLSIPAGALTSPVAITAIVVEGVANHVELLPHGLLFNTPASLTLSYAHCEVPDGLPPKRIAHTDQLLNIRYYVPSVDEWADNQVTGQLDHFSDYAVAW